jgi:hypothetical protein
MATEYKQEHELRPLDVAKRIEYFKFLTNTKHEQADMRNLICEMLSKEYPTEVFNFFLKGLVQSVTEKSTPSEEI